MEREGPRPSAARVREGKGFRSGKLPELRRPPQAESGHPAAAAPTEAGLPSKEQPREVMHRSISALPEEGKALQKEAPCSVPTPGDPCSCTARRPQERRVMCIAAESPRLEDGEVSWRQGHGCPLANARYEEHAYELSMSLFTAIRSLLAMPLEEKQWHGVARPSSSSALTSRVSLRSEPSSSSMDNSVY